MTIPVNLPHFTSPNDGRLLRGAIEVLRNRRWDEDDDEKLKCSKVLDDDEDDGSCWWWMDRWISCPAEELDVDS